jgi:hypothetical protein
MDGAGRVEGTPVGAVRDLGTLPRSRRTRSYGKLQVVPVGLISMVPWGRANRSAHHGEGGHRCPTAPFPHGAGRLFRGDRQQAWAGVTLPGSLAPREFLRLDEYERVPGHSWLSCTCSRLPLEVHDQVLTWVLGRLAEHGLIQGERMGVASRRWRPAQRCTRRSAARAARECGVAKSDRPGGKDRQAEGRAHASRL